MKTVNTVVGRLSTENLGFTLMHEHLLAGTGGVYQNYPELYDQKPMDRIVQLLTEAKDGGVDTFVDAGTMDLDRNVHVLVEASKRTGMNIIACTGFWLDIPRCFYGVSADRMAELFVREFEEGISGTKVKPGILKTASDMGGVKPEEEIALRAVARAHLKTNLPIMVHSYSPGRVGLQQLAILKEEGVNPRRVKMDHCSDTTDIEYLLMLLEEGCYLGMERYPGRQGQLSALARARTMKALIDAGYAERLCPSQDGICVPADKRFMINPNGFLAIKKVLFPHLREMGVSEQLLSRLCVVGPRNFFEGV